MLRRRLGNERGATLVFLAVSLGALFGFMALAIDLGMMYVAHEDAQRAADAGALAGASAFLDYAPGAASPTVITSYSIHYTKLYDGGGRTGLHTRRPNTWRCAKMSASTI